MTLVRDGAPMIILVSAPSCIKQIVRRSNSTEDQCGTYHSKSTYKLTEKKHALIQEKNGTKALRSLLTPVLN